MPFNASNWKKLVEDNFLTYGVSDALYKNYTESKPYWALCPDCYEELFSGLRKYVTRTTTEIKEIDNCFTKSTADYYEHEPIVINANSDLSGLDVFIGQNTVDLDKTVAMPRV